MMTKLLICTDLDRTLIPNGHQQESDGARQRFHALANHAKVTVAYVSGRDRSLVIQAIKDYNLPVPDFVIGDVGTTLFEVHSENDWRCIAEWQHEMAPDWNGKHSQDIRQLLIQPELSLQEAEKQNDFKLSYYAPPGIDQKTVSKSIHEQLKVAQINANLIWSMDEPRGICLLDILPARASKYHAIQALMKLINFDLHNTVFCGDSGNDLEVLISPIASVLVANSQLEVREKAITLARQAGNEDSLYIAAGNFLDMNGNYSAGMLEGIAHFYPETADWMALT